MAVGLDRIVEGVNDVLCLRVRCNTLQVFRHRLPGYCQAAPVQQAPLQQHLHQRLNATDRHQFRHHVMPAWAQIRQHRYALSNLDKILQAQLNINCAGHCQKVENRVG